MVRQLILEKLDAIGLKMSEASIKIGRNHAYLQQFIKRGVPAELGEREREKLAELLKVSADELRGPSNPLPARSYERKTPTPQGNGVEVVNHPSYTPTTGLNESAAKFVPAPDLFGAGLDLPVFGTAQGGQDGALIVTDGAVDWVGRPTVLLRVQDGYGMIVTGDSMSPEHKEGSIALVNPHLPPRVGDSCIFRNHKDDGTTLALIKEYRGQDVSHWKVRQHNPPKDFKLKKAEWQVVHRTVGNYFP